MNILATEEKTEDTVIVTYFTMKTLQLLVREPADRFSTSSSHQSLQENNVTCRENYYFSNDTQPSSNEINSNSLLHGSNSIQRELVV